MTRTFINRTRFAGLALSAVVAGVSLSPANVSAQEARPSFEQMSNLERGVTKPREEPKVVFVGPGVVMKIEVKEGDTVKAGQVLAVQDDREEQAKLQLRRSLTRN